MSITDNEMGIKFYRINMNLNEDSYLQICQLTVETSRFQENAMVPLYRQIETLPNITELERLQLRIELLKAWGTIVAIFIPLCIGAISIATSVVLANRRASVDFELKAAEIVMNASTPAAAANKAAVLVELFPSQLSPRFPEKLRELYDDPVSANQHNKRRE